MNTLLPNGNGESSEGGKTMIQGIYNKESKTVYATDLLLWNNELFIDSIAELRLIVLINKVKGIPLLSEIEGAANEVRFRVPLIRVCSKSAVEELYYGAYSSVKSPCFALKYEKLVNYALERGLLSQLKLSLEDVRTEQGALKLCGSFGEDTKEDWYLKNGVAFIKKNGTYFLGYNESTLQWKDSLTSQRFEHLVASPLRAHLRHTADRKLVTHDGYVVRKTDPLIDQLEAEQMYVFSYEGASVDDLCATLYGLKCLKESKKSVGTSMSEILFKALAKSGMLNYGALVEEVERQQTALN